MAARIAVGCLHQPKVTPLLVSQTLVLPNLLKILMNFRLYPKT